MPFRIVCNDITKMQTDASVNTANELVTVGPGCDHAVYEAAGYEELLPYRKNHIGEVKEGEEFITLGFRLPARYIIHAVNPGATVKRSGFGPAIGRALRWHQKMAFALSLSP